MLRSLVVLAALGPLGFSAVAAPRESRATPRSEVASKAPAVPRTASQAAKGAGSRIATRATQLVGVRSLRTVDRTVPDDCTGLVRLAYEGADIHLMEGAGRKGDNGVTAIYRKARSQGALHRGRPKPGDLVFFRETYDQNRDGKRNDGLTHVGVVERVDASGRITIIHRGSKGIARTRMNLQRPTTHREKRSGEIVNDYIRRASGKQRAYLTGELFAGFASPGPLARARATKPSR
jgi:hypothetical protein